MTMPKREVNNIWSRVRADVDVDDLIFEYDRYHSYEDGDSCSDHAAGNKRQKAAAGLKRPCCGFFCSLLKSKRKRYIWKERPRIEGEGVKNAE